MRSRLTYANVMATIAVFVALGGSSYAALKITGRDVADSSLTGRDVKNESLTNRDVTASFGYIRFGPPGTAELTYGSGIRKVEPLGVTNFDITFPKGIKDCVVHATPGAGEPNIAGVTMSARVARVSLRPPVPAEGAFLVSLVC